MGGGENFKKKEKRKKEKRFYLGTMTTILFERAGNRIRQLQTNT